MDATVFSTHVMTQRSFHIGIVLFISLWLVGFIRWMPSFSGLFTSDAEHYSQAAIHLLAQGLYSIDGTTPFFAREPGMSIFLAGIYALFGNENGLALVILQGILFFFASLFFSHEVSKTFSSRIGTFCFFLLLTHISVLHTIFSAYRECLALILFLTSFAFLLRLERQRSFSDAFFAGALLGGGILTYISFLFFPLLLPIVLRVCSVAWRHIVIVFIVTYAVASPWIIRNATYGERAYAESQVRMTYVWHVRGVQAEKVMGLEPLRCLYAEYISRDWAGLSDACSFNSVKNRLIAETNVTDHAAEITKEGQQKILRHPVSYLWFSLVDTLELHMPFVGGGWSGEYNLLAMISSIFLYIGCLMGLPALRDRRMLLFLSLALYNTAFFALTDATPRYLLPVLFCYALLGAIGYDRSLARFFPRPL